MHVTRLFITLWKQSEQHYNILPFHRSVKKNKQIAKEKEQKHGH